MKPLFKISCLAKKRDGNKRLWWVVGAAIILAVLTIRSEWKNGASRNHPLDSHSRSGRLEEIQLKPFEKDATTARSKPRTIPVVTKGEDHVRRILPKTEMKDPAAAHFEAMIFISNYQNQHRIVLPPEDLVGVDELTDAYATLLGVKEYIGDPDLRKRFDESLAFVEAEIIKLLDGPNP